MPVNTRPNALHEGLVVLNDMPLAPVSYESQIPCDFRIAQYPDGSRRVQGAYLRVGGLESYPVWRDLPVVEVDAQGEAL